jgi:hypothetical protein
MGCNLIVIGFLVFELILWLIIINNKSVCGVYGKKDNMEKGEMDNMGKDDMDSKDNMD